MVPPSTTTPVSGVLGPLGTEVVGGINDTALRARVFRAVAVCDEALRVVDALDLSPYEGDEGMSEDLALWNELAPAVRSILVTVGHASRILRELFGRPGEPSEPATVDLEVALATLEQGEPPAPIRDQREQEIDRIVSQTTDLYVAYDGVHELASMLHSDFQSFGARLRNPSVVTDRWLLLAELQELKAKCTQCLEAVVATLVQPFTTDSLHIILPRYASATAKAILLRTQLVNLAHDVKRLNDKVQRCDAERAMPVRHAVAVRLGEFIGHEAYRYLRPADKRELSRFRIDLNAYEHEIQDMVAFRTLIDGLSVFLSVLRSINQRDQLLQHDLQALQTIAMLAEAEAEDDDLAPPLLSVFGRDPELDELIRAIRRGGPIDHRALVPIVERVYSLLRRGP